MKDRHKIQIPFNRPRVSPNTDTYIKKVLASNCLSARGEMTRHCEKTLTEIFQAPCILVNSATAALECMIMLTNIGPGDEVILPSFTFPSTANAIALRGGIPVFVDIEATTLNICPRSVERAITSRTKAIMPVHYAGYACDLVALENLAKKYELYLLPDAAHAFGATSNGRELACWGDLSAISFHETKNISCGEGGALIVNRPRFLSRAELLRDKGTNRSEFLRGKVEKYSWVDIGSSYGPSELIAAVLRAQLEEVSTITKTRTALWERYHGAFRELEILGKIRRPVIPRNQTGNGHIYYILVNDTFTRNNLLKRLNDEGIGAVFHYVPLHSSVAGKKLGRASGTFKNTNKIFDSLIRLPIYADMTVDDQNYIIERIQKYFSF